MKEQERRQAMEFRSWREGEFWCASVVHAFTLTPEEVCRSRYSRQRAIAYAMVEYAVELERYEPVTEVDGPIPRAPTL